MKRYQFIVNGTASEIIVNTFPTDRWNTVKDSDRTLWACMKEQEIIELDSIDAAINYLVTISTLQIERWQEYTRLGNKILSPWKVIDRVGDSCS